MAWAEHALYYKQRLQVRWHLRRALRVRRHLPLLENRAHFLSDLLSVQVGVDGWAPWHREWSPGQGPLEAPT